MKVKNIRLRDDPSRTMIYSYSQERRSPGWRRKDPIRAHSLQERRSPGWRWKDPSWGFLAPRRGAHRVGGGKIRLVDFLLPGEALTGLEMERWRWKDPSQDFLLPGEALTGLEAERSVGGKIRLRDDPSRTMIYSYSQERRSPGWRWKHPSGIVLGMIRLGP